MFCELINKVDSQLWLEYSYTNQLVFAGRKGIRIKSGLNCESSDKSHGCIYKIDVKYIRKK
jgi:hypothetical protein